MSGHDDYPLRKMAGFYTGAVDQPTDPVSRFIVCRKVAS
jgi:hypothetical protein